MLSVVLREIPLEGLIDLKYGMFPLLFIIEAMKQIKNIRLSLWEWNVFYFILQEGI